MSDDDGSDEEEVLEEEGEREGMEGGVRCADGDDGGSFSC